MCNMTPGDVIFDFLTGDTPIDAIGDPTLIFLNNLPGDIY